MRSLRAEFTFKSSASHRKEILFFLQKVAFLFTCQRMDETTKGKFSVSWKYLTLPLKFSHQVNVNVRVFS